MLTKIQNGCSVGFYGLGRSNLSLLQKLPLRNCKITIRSDFAIDRGSIPNDARILEGEKALLNINEDIIFFSPSVRRERPELMSAKERGVIFSSDAELFFAENRRPVIAISGSDGKSTTATLTNLLLTSDGTDSRLIGNVGEPMFAFLGRADRFVAELSSFMLNYFTPRVKRACLTNITPNHLDWHKDFEEYKEAKISLVRSADEFVITDELSDISGAYGIVSVSKDFRQLKSLYRADNYLTLESGWILHNGKKLISLDKIHRKEAHNLLNFMMAIALSDASSEAIISVGERFSGLPHRCERFFSHNGVDFYDSSIDTSPARTSETMLSLNRKAVVILGGKSKGLDYSEMLPALIKNVVYAVICGENKNEIYSSISHTVPCRIADDFESAIRLGASIASEVGALVLSPASASYDEFRDYRQRGETFKRIIYDLYKGEK